MRPKTLANLVLVLTLLGMAPLISTLVAPAAHAENSFTLTPFPIYSQEGNTVALVLSVSNANTSTTYQFVFSVKDPANKTVSSPVQTYTTGSSQNQFSIPLNYPSPTFMGSNSLVGTYTAQVYMAGSILTTPLATTHFFFGITDNLAYQRTQTVNMRASGYLPSESVSISIVPKSTPLFTAFSQTVVASSAGTVTTSWKIPVNATIDTYVLSLAGTTTTKSPPDIQPFLVKEATMTISKIMSLQSSYQRTDTLQFSFQPTYPDGSLATTNVALMTLARPDGRNVTFTATYDNNSQSFVLNYKTSPDNETGTWSASLAAFAYGDSYGNFGPSQIVTSSVQLTPASLNVNVYTGTSFAVGQQMSFNASITYPDGTVLQSGTVAAYLVLGGSQSVNKSVPMVFDTNLKLWVGTYTWQQSDGGGLWSLNLKASDSPSPPNSGLATRAVILDNATAGSTSFPLYFFGIAAVLIAAGVLGGLIVFRRRRHSSAGASLKIDLEAVKSEAGRIEGQDFFQSIRDQVAKDKDD